MKTTLKVPLMILEGNLQIYYLLGESHYSKDEVSDVPKDEGLIKTLENDLCMDTDSFNEEEYLEILKYIRYRLNSMDIAPEAIDKISIDRKELVIYGYIKFESILEEE